MKRNPDERRGRGLHDRDSVIIKDGWDVFGGEFVCCVGDEQAGFAYGAIADDDTSESGAMSVDAHEACS